MHKTFLLKYVFYSTTLALCLVLMPFSHAGSQASPQTNMQTNPQASMQTNQHANMASAVFAQSNTASKRTTPEPTLANAPVNTTKGIRIAAPHFFRYTGLSKSIATAFKKDTGLTIEWSWHNAPELEQYVTRCNADAFLLNNPELERYLVDAKVAKVWKPFLSYELFLIGSPQLVHILSPHSLLDSLITVVKRKIVFIGQKDSSDEIHLERFFWQLLYVTPYESEWYINSGERLGKEITGLLRVGKAVTIASNMWWLDYQENKGNLNDDVVVLTEKDPLLIAHYNILSVNDFFCPTVNTADTKTFIDWLKTDNALELIDNFEYLGKNIFKAMLLR